MANKSLLVAIAILVSLSIVSVEPLMAGERLNRGLVALSKDRKQVYLGWRLLQSDKDNTGFNIYRYGIMDDSRVKVNLSPVKGSTNFIDTTVADGSPYRYQVVPVMGGKEGEPSEKTYVRAFPFDRPYIQILVDGDYTAHNVAIADLDSDGAYDYVIKQPDFNTDPWREKGYWKRSRDTFKLEAYSSKGKFLWRYDLGWSIEMGTWYSPYLVYDVDGDGRAELYAKAGEGDPRELDGHVLSGSEYLVKIDGLRGTVQQKIPWLSRKGFDTVSHVTRNFLAVAYLNGLKPSLIMQRGTYGIIKTLALDKNLEEIWYWEASGKYESYQGMGQHSLTAADIDQDGRDELVIGAAAIDEHGKGLWNTELGHNDVGYVADLDPSRPGLEIFYGIEPPRQSKGVCLVQASTGKIIWAYDGPTKHVHSQGMVGDIDASHPGMECYAGESDRSQFWLYAADGTRLSDQAFCGNDIAPRAIWWDEDQQKEIVCDNRIFNFEGGNITEIEGKIIGIADCLGDWREEIITSLPGEIRIYSTTIPSTSRRTCLMQDRQYRLGVAAQSMGYFYPPQLGGNKIP